MLIKLFNKEIINLIKEITIAEFKSRDQSKALGFLWTLLYPLSMFLITYLIFAKWTASYITNFAPYLLVGIVQWNFFANATSAAMSIMLRRRGYARSFYFPYQALIISSVICSLGIHLLELLLVLPVIFWMSSGLSFTVLLLPVVVLLETLLILGISFILSGLFVFFRDMEYLWSIILRLTIFTTPLFYSLDMLSRKQRILVLANPLTYILDISRSVLVYKTVPAIDTVLIVIFVTLMSLGVGYSFFKIYAAKFAELM